MTIVPFFCYLAENKQGFIKHPKFFDFIWVCFYFYYYIFTLPFYSENAGSCEPAFYVDFDYTRAAVMMAIL